MEWGSFWSGIIGAVIGAIVTGFFTIWVAKFNLNESRKTREEEKKLFFNTNRPEFEIVKFKQRGKYVKIKSQNITLLLARIKNFDGTYMSYSPEILNEEKIEEVCYSIKNVGKTDIVEVWFTANYVKEFSIFYYDEYLNHPNMSKLLSTKVCYDDIIIRQGQSINLKFILLSQERLTNGVSAPVSIWFRDANNNWWQQPIFVPQKKLYESNMTSLKHFKELTDEVKILECFREPRLW